MKIKDLIKKLSLIDPDMDVMIDLTPDDAEMFKFAELVNIDEVELEDKTKFVCLSAFSYESNDFYNN